MANNYRSFSEMLALNTDAEREWCKSYLKDLGDTEDGTEFGYAFEDQGLWVFTEEYGNVDRVADLVQEFFKEFRPDGIFTLSWSDTCSKPRLGEFGGGAVCVTRNTVEWMTTDDWLTDKQKGHEAELERLFQR